jgi:hypothetical protein
MNGPTQTGTAASPASLIFEESKVVVVVDIEDRRPRRLQRSGRGIGVKRQVAVLDLVGLRHVVLLEELPHPLLDSDLLGQG